jgi:hypothetical protein
MNQCWTGISILLYQLGKYKYGFSKIYKPGRGIEALKYYQSM